MATSFDVVESLALATVDDYKLQKLYNQDITQFEAYCDSFLFSAVPNFTQCQQSLAYDTATREFTADLTNLEISILADWWIIEWMSREKNNSAQIQLKLKVSSSFQFNSEAQNLKEKVVTIDKMMEFVDLKTTKYLLDSQFSNFSW